MMKSRILVGALTAPLRATLSRWLLGAGYAVELAESPPHAREVASKAGIALSYCIAATQQSPTAPVFNGVHRLIAHHHDLAIFESAPEVSGCIGRAVSSRRRG